MSKLPPIDGCTQIGYRTQGLPLVEYVPLPAPKGEPACGAAFHDRIMIDTIHDGCIIPEAFLLNEQGERFDDSQFSDAYICERDWGANLVAERIASRLGISGYYRVNVARVLMDFGRFPGITPPSAAHLRRYAINYPFSSLLSYQQKIDLLESCYDPISEFLEQAIQNKVIKIAIHTYDTYNSDKTIRPPTSIVSRSASSLDRSGAPIGVFDPLYPKILADFTADRTLRDRLSLTLERSNIPVAHNYPYTLPEGSLEVRSQVWFFFTHLKQAFEEQPENVNTPKNPAFQRVWDMLLDTNLRSSDSEALRGYLHMFRRPLEGQEEIYGEIRIAYERVKKFAEANNSQVVREYRSSQERPSSMGIEIRKDLVWEFDDEGRSIGPKTESAHYIADVIAEAILTYLAVDRRKLENAKNAHPRHKDDPWEARTSPLSI